LKKQETVKASTILIGNFYPLGRFRAAMAERSRVPHVLNGEKRGFCQNQ
jgi:hypothetical protein